MTPAVDEDALRSRWQRLCSDLAVPDMGDTTWQVLRGAYTEPHRAYHNLTHIAECLAQLDYIAGVINPPEHGTLEMALWFHDVVYDTHRHDNEEVSAALAERHLARAGVPRDHISHITHLILATKHSPTPPIGDAAWIVDIDLAILGANAPRFDEYEKQIRAEYHWVPEPDFRKGRAAVLRMFLERDAIYMTPAFHTRYEKAARENLQRSLNALAG
ncbi:N-methyl-D-aspartate receptor NMDAR2C subunit [Roseimicrobium sp. ORNL1]|uniref:HD domain-containing protein n=1 Tax=Roseimicrobium sp. ORNL1 TaxID=2711231 RepID=UPI0013E20669|nr:N-methyl-D-aspartate receptor NMDAR2C subunit [Roseimicrobium sp. ORNL1]QIF04888.1 N-methyl-D-aspartate receptor NMDAR2C subunit [Roseimicrobium sp. ORNL1]